jgi:radical SAM superfamily enzyme YgiQ (UPF0313 family)
VSTFRRLLLVSANRERYPEPVFPIGAAYVAEAARQAGAEVRILDLSVARFPELALRRAIHAFQPDLVGLSLRNLDNSGYPFTPFYLPQYQALVKVIRDATKAPVVLGGAAFAMFPEQFLDRLGAEAGVIGDGEAGLGEILAGGLPGGDRVVQGVLPDLEPVTFPSGIGRMLPRWSRHRTIGVQSARGCPHRCLYCSYPTLEGRVIRRRPPERITEDLAFLAAHGKKEFFFVDSSFNADEAHLAAVLEAILRRGLRIRFACYLEPKMADPNLFGLLAKAGCEAIDFGVDSAAPALLRSMQKGFTQEDILRSSEACQRAGIDFCHSLIFGGPGETLATLRETIALVRECRPTAVTPMTGLRIYPGTDLERRARAEGLLAPDDDLFEPRFHFGGWDPDELIATVHREAGRSMNWFFPAAKDWRASRIYRLLTALQPKRPMWRNIPGDNLPWFLERALRP